MTELVDNDPCVPINADHRFEPVREVKAVMYVNDAGAVNANATRYSLERVKGSVVWIATAYPFATDYSCFCNMDVANIRALILMGSESEIRQVFAGRIELVGTVFNIRQAVVYAALIAEPGDTVLFSPASPASRAGYYARRGERFKKTVWELR